MAIYVSKIGQRIYYFSVAIICLIAMFMSGTRGAMIVPIGGLMLYTLMSKNLKACILGGLSLIFLYVFFAFTTIGQSNVMIRRMRTAFTPSEDASFNVRKENRQKLATYINTRPFGEGIGLSGVENQKYPTGSPPLYPTTPSMSRSGWRRGSWAPSFSSESTSSVCSGRRGLSCSR